MMSNYSQETIDKGEIFRCLLSVDSDSAISFLRICNISKELSVYITKEVTLNYYIIMRMFEYFDKECLIKYQSLDETFIQNNLSSFVDNYQVLIENQELSEETLTSILDSYDSLDNVPKGIITAISGTQKLSKEFIEKYGRILDWTALTSSYDMDIDFMNRYYTLIDWKVASTTQCVYSKFLNLCANQLDWVAVSRYQTLTEEELKKYGTRLNMRLALKYQKYFTYNVVSYLELFVPWEIVPIYVKIPENLWEERFFHMIRWELMCQYQIMSEKFMTRYIDFIKWDLVSQYQVLSEDFIRNYKDKVDWEKIAKYQTLSDTFKEEFKTELSPYL